MYIPGIHYVYRQNESDIGRGTESRGKCHLENETDFIEFACTYIYLYVYHTYGNSVTAASIPGIKTMILFIIFSKHFFFFPSHLLSSPFCSLSLLVVIQIRGHTAGCSSPIPTAVRALHFLSREDFSSFFPRRLASKCAYLR